MNIVPNFMFYFAFQSKIVFESEIQYRYVSVMPISCFKLGAVILSSVFEVCLLWKEILIPLIDHAMLIGWNIELAIGYRCIYFT